MTIYYKNLILCVSIFILGLTSLAIGNALSPIEQLGERLYFDEKLSEPDGQSCASCHRPDVGFDDPEDELPVSEGVIPGLFGGRNSPMSAYAMYAPKFHFDGELPVGGQFWDGRATGQMLDDPLAHQALGPFLNPVEMANPNKASVIADIAASDYAVLFEQVWGPGSLNDVEKAYEQVALSIAAFERTSLFAQFTSKYDAYLQACLDAGQDKDACAMGLTEEALTIAEGHFSKQEFRGFKLFMGENNNDGILDPNEGAMCAACHTAEWTEVSTDTNGNPVIDGNPVIVPSWSPFGFVPPMFTDFTFDNLGIPKSKDKLLVKNPPDLGLGVVTANPDNNGKFKVMTLRNIKETMPYGHNGFFNELEEITHFYNTRDVKGMGWQKPEYPATVNHDELGNLGLNPEDEAAIAHFMKTLSDGWYTP